MLSLPALRHIIRLDVSKVRFLNSTPVKSFQAWFSNSIGLWMHHSVSGPSGAAMTCTGCNVVAACHCRRQSIILMTLQQRCLQVYAPVFEHTGTVQVVNQVLTSARGGDCTGCSHPVWRRCSGPAVG